MFKNPWLEKQVRIWKRRFLEGFTHKPRCVLRSWHLCSCRRAISNHINTARCVGLQVCPYTNVQPCWGSDLGMLSSMDQQQHLYKLNASILDSACCSIPASPKPERLFRSRLATSTPHSTQPWTSFESHVVFAGHMTQLLFVVHLFSSRFLGAPEWCLVTWNGAPVFSAVGPWQESTRSGWGHSQWCADITLEEECWKDTDKSGTVFTTPT